MTDDLNRHWQRWQEADSEGQNSEREDDADAACRALFAAAALEPTVTPAFTARTVATINTSVAAERVRARRLRRALLAGSVAAAVVGVYAGGPWLLSALAGAVAGAINLLVGVTVGIAVAVQAGTDVWTVLGGLGRAAAAFVANPTVTVVMLAMQAIAVMALITLQRLLGAEKESFE